MSTTTPPTDEFFVGYLPTPRRTARSLRLIFAAGLLGVVTLGAVFGAAQRDVGPGNWSDESTTFTGKLSMNPYPMVQLPTGELILLAAEGKHRADMLPADGQTVSITGTVLSREGIRMVELTDSPKPSAGVTSFPSLAGSSSKPITLTGEIVDFKCFLGAMKPGSGKTHKACAILCLRGGLPPVLVSNDGRRLLVTNSDGSGLSSDSLEKIIPFVADPVTVDGDIVPTTDPNLSEFRLRDIRR